MSLAIAASAALTAPLPRWIELARRGLLSTGPSRRTGLREPALDQALDPEHREPARAAAEALTSAEVDAADRRDVGAALDGDGGAFARIVERHQAAIARHLYRFTRDRSAHEELVQDVFVEAWRSLAGYRGSAPLLHWLRRIATRVGYRHWTSRARQREEAGAADAGVMAALATAPDELAPREAAELVHVLLARLAPRDRLVLTLVYLEGCSVAEAADLTGWSRTMVKVQAHRARKRLAALLQRKPS